jgi:protein ImuB
VVVADHRPECASRAVPVAGPFSAATPGPAVPPAAQQGLPLHRPTWLLPEPMPLAERDAMPLLHGQPLQLVSGPERIETGWWDDGSVARDYFIARAHDGCLVWIFRSRLPAAPGPLPEPAWHLQGLFG